MLRRGVAVAGVMALTGALLGRLPAGAAPSTDRGHGLEVYVGQVDAAELEMLHRAGLDHKDLRTVVDLLAGPVDVVDDGRGS